MMAQTEQFASCTTIYFQTISLKVDPFSYYLNLAKAMDTTFTKGLNLHFLSQVVSKIVFQFGLTVIRIINQLLFCNIQRKYCISQF